MGGTRFFTIWRNKRATLCKAFLSDLLKQEHRLHCLLPPRRPQPFTLRRGGKLSILRARTSRVRNPLIAYGLATAGSDFLVADLTLLFPVALRKYLYMYSTAGLKIKRIIIITIYILSIPTSQIHQTLYVLNSDRHRNFKTFSESALPPGLLYLHRDRRIGLFEMTSWVDSERELFMEVPLWELANVVFMYDGQRIAKSDVTAGSIPMCTCNRPWINRGVL